MKQPEVTAIENNYASTGLHRAYLALRSNITAANLVALAGGVLLVFMLIALREPWSIRVPLYLTVLVWTILQPRMALYLMPFAVPWGSLDFIDVKGLRMNSADLLVAFLIIGWLMSFALRRIPSKSIRGRLSASPGPLDRAPSNVPAYLVFAILALFGAMFLSMTVAISKVESLKEISKWLEFLVLILLGTQYIRTRRQVWTIVVITCLAGITQALFGYIQFFFDIGPASFIRDASLRIYGTFDQPNPYAGYINLPLSIALALMLLGSNWKTRILAGVTAFFLATAEFLTQSRGGEVAIAAALLFIVTVGIPRLRVVVGLLSLASLVGAAAYLAGLIPIYLFNPILTRLGLVGISLSKPTDQTFSTAERLAHWIAGLRMFFDHPLLGVGIGNYAQAYPQYFVTIFTDPLGHAHNYYINIAAETGSIGLIAYLLFILAIFIAGGHSYRYITSKWMQAAYGRCRSPIYRGTAIYRAGGWGKTHSNLLISLQAPGNVQYPGRLAKRDITAMFTNDRALSIGLLAALIAVCVHNVFDDLYVHSLTNLIALLIIILIRLEKVTPKVGGKEDNIAYN
jgi:O-antigen ligase